MGLSLSLSYISLEQEGCSSKIVKKPNHPYAPNQYVTEVMLQSFLPSLLMNMSGLVYCSDALTLQYLMKKE
jgi:hypothetical protein